MCAAVHLARSLGHVSGPDAKGILDVVSRYGPIPALRDIAAERISARLVKDKKTIQGKIHFVLPRRIGEVVVVSGVDEGAVLSAIRRALA